MTKIDTESSQTGKPAQPILIIHNMNRDRIEPDPLEFFRKLECDRTVRIFPGSGIAGREAGFYANAVDQLDSLDELITMSGAITPDTHRVPVVVGIDETDPPYMHPTNGHAVWYEPRDTQKIRDSKSTDAKILLVSYVHEGVLVVVNQNLHQRFIGLLRQEISYNVESVRVIAEEIGVDERTTSGRLSGIIAYLSINDYNPKKNLLDSIKRDVNSILERLNFICNTLRIDLDDDFTPLPILDPLPIEERAGSSCAS